MAAWAPAGRGGGLARERGAAPPLGAKIGAERAEGGCHIGVPPCEGTSELPCAATKELPWEAHARESKASSTTPRCGAACGSGGGAAGGIGGGGSGTPAEGECCGSRVGPGAGGTGGFEGTWSEAAPCTCTLHKLLALMLSLYWKAGSGGRRSDSGTSVHCRRFEAEERPWELEPRPDAVVPKLARELVAEPWPRLDLLLARGLSCGPPDDGDAALAPAPAPHQEEGRDEAEAEAAAEAADAEGGAKEHGDETTTGGGENSRGGACTTLCPTGHTGGPAPAADGAAA